MRQPEGFLATRPIGDKRTSVKAFNRRFCDAMCGINRPSHCIMVSSGMKADIKIWLSFLENFNGTYSFGKNIWLSNSQLVKQWEPTPKM
jgi:hypothetical protein